MQLSCQILSRHDFILLSTWCCHFLSAAPECCYLKVSKTKVAGRRDENWLIGWKTVWMALCTFRFVSTLSSPFSSSSFIISFLPLTENSPTTFTSGMADVFSEYSARASKALRVSCTRRTCWNVSVDSTKQPNLEVFITWDDLKPPR